MLRNEERPPIWEHVSDWIDRNGALANSDLCRIAAVDTLRASKMLKGWVAQGILLRDDAGGKRHTVYRKPNPDGDAYLAAMTLVMAAVSVVLPWSTCPIVPTLTCGFLRSNLALDMTLSPRDAEK